MNRKSKRPMPSRQAVTRFVNTTGVRLLMAVPTFDQQRAKLFKKAA